MPLPDYMTEYVDYSTLVFLTPIGLSPVNAEPLQVVRYGPVQRFSLHHDAGTLLEDGAVAGMIKPRRLITFFLVSIRIFIAIPENTLFITLRFVMTVPELAARRGRSH